MSVAAPTSIGRVSKLVGETLADDRISRTTSGRLPLGVEDERELARSVVVRHLDELAAEHLANGLEPLDVNEEDHLVEAVLAKVLGLGRIQPLLDDPDVNDIHIRGSASTRLKLIDGRRIPSRPVVDSDEELVELVRLVATRVGRQSRG